MGRRFGTKAQKTIEAEAKILPLVSSLTIREIAETLGYPFIFVKNLCRRAKVSTKRHTYTLQTKPGPGTMAEKVFEALLSTDKSQRQIARELGCSFQHVSLVRKRYLGGRI